jgi:stearoyl-CoA desaturase (delta-9 desaturase)
LNILTSPLDRQAALAASAGSDAHADLQTTFFEKAGVLLGVLVPFLALLWAVYHFWGHGIGPVDLVLLLSMYSITVIGICVGYHRLLTHRAFETYPAMRFLLTVLGSMALQGPALQWCAVHRRHHQQSDRPGDPHSPHQHGHGFFGFLSGMWHSHVGWLFESTPNDTMRSIQDLWDDPAVRLADRLFWVWVPLGLIIPAAIGGIIGHSWYAAWTGFLWGGLVRMCLMHHATFSINSVCHLWGTRPYISSDESRNNPVFGLVSFGEGWHNNHHAFPTSARHGLEWYQIDISWMFIWVLKTLRLAWNVRLPSDSAMKAKLRKKESPQVPTISIAATPDAGA